MKNRRGAAVRGMVIGTVSILIAGTAVFALTRGPLTVRERNLGTIEAGAQPNQAGALAGHVDSGHVQPQAGTSATASTWLYLDAVPIGAVRSVAGCSTYAGLDVAGDKTHSLLGHVLDPCVIKFGPIDNKGKLKAWITGQLSGKSSGIRALSLVGYTHDYDPMFAVKVAMPILTRFVVPAADAANSDPVFLTATITGDSIMPADPDDYSLPTTLAAPAAAPKNLYANTFRLQVNDAMVPGAQEVKAFSMSRPFDGERPGAWSLSDLTVVTAYTKPEPFASWYRDTVLQEDPPTKTRSVELDFLTRDLANTLFQLNVEPAGLYEGDLGTGTVRTWTMFADGASVKFPVTP